MNKAGPYQYCEKCKTEKPHQWIDVIVIKCIECSLETKVQAPNPIEKTISELTPVEPLTPVDKIVQPPKPVVKKVEPPKGDSLVFETELPLQGHLIKPEPIEGKMYGTEYKSIPGYPNTSARTIIMDTDVDPGPPFKELDTKTMKPKIDDWAAEL